MSFSSETAKVQYNGDGATAEFAVPFYFLSNADVQVVHRDAADVETLWVEGSQYTLTGVGNTSGGLVTVSTFPTNYTPLADETLTISRSLSKVQETDYPEGGAFPAAAHEQALDRVVQLVQQLQEEVDRSLKFPISDASLTSQVDSSTDRANKYLNFDAAGNVSLDTAVGNWQGTYSASTTYTINDVISQNGSSYISLVSSNLANTPPVPASSPDSYWDLVSEKGDTGAIGAAGTNGTNGIDGTMVGPGGSTDNGIATYNGTDGTTVQDTGWTIDDSEVMTAGGDLDMSGSQIQWSKGADVASDAALPVLTDGNYIDVTGTTTITSIDTTGGAGTQIKLHFDGVLTLTHHATNLILPGGVDITTTAGDEAEFIEYGSGTYRCTNYMKASGEAVVASFGGGWAFVSSVTASGGGTIPFTGMESGYDYMLVGQNILAATDTVRPQFQLGITGPTYRTSGYLCHTTQIDSSGNSGTGNITANIAFTTPTNSSGNVTGEEVKFELLLIDPAASSKTNFLCDGHTRNGTPDHISGWAKGHYDTAEAHTAIKFFFHSGNIASGTIYLYKKANA